MSRATTVPKQPQPSSGRLFGWLLTGVLAMGVGYEVHRVEGVYDKLYELETREANRLAGARDVDTEISALGGEIASLKNGLERTSGKLGRTESLADRIITAETRLQDMGLVVEANSNRLSTLSTFGREALEAELNARDERLLHRWEAFEDLAVSANELAAASSRKLDELGNDGPRDLRTMWRELVGPVVQLAGDASVGSGVLLRSSYDEEADRHITYLITAWHVVRDIQGDLSKTDMPVPVTLYHEDGSLRYEEAGLIVFDEDLDAALLEIWTDDALLYGAALAGRKRLEEVKIFDSIYAVGCPLGNDPIPTRGEIATCHHEVDGETYWMINAPTYIGNSGGGIFDGETHELLGIFSKIYTHGSLRPTIVPHMGLVTPLAEIYEWLEAEGYGHVEKMSGAVEERAASAER